MKDGKYARAHRRSIEDPEGFWGEAARGIDWITAPRKVMDDSRRRSSGGSRAVSSTPATTPWTGT